MSIFAAMGDFIFKFESNGSNGSVAVEVKKGDSPYEKITAENLSDYFIVPHQCSHDKNPLMSTIVHRLLDKTVTPVGNVPCGLVRVDLVMPEHPAPRDEQALIEQEKQNFALIVPKLPADKKKEQDMIVLSANNHLFFFDHADQTVTEINTDTSISKQLISQFYSKGNHNFKVASGSDCKLIEQLSHSYLLKQNQSRHRAKSESDEFLRAAKQVIQLCSNPRLLLESDGEGCSIMQKAIELHHIEVVVLLSEKFGADAADLFKEAGSVEKIIKMINAERQNVIIQQSAAMIQLDGLKKSLADSHKRPRDGDLRRWRDLEREIRQLEESIKNRDKDIARLGDQVSQLKRITVKSRSPSPQSDYSKLYELVGKLEATIPDLRKAKRADEADAVERFVRKFKINFVAQEYKYNSSCFRNEQGVRDEVRFVYECRKPILQLEEELITAATAAREQAPPKSGGFFSTSKILIEPIVRSIELELLSKIESKIEVLMQEQCTGLVARAKQEEAAKLLAKQEEAAKLLAKQNEQIVGTQNPEVMPEIEQVPLAERELPASANMQGPTVNDHHLAVHDIDGHNTAQRLVVEDEIGTNEDDEESFCNGFDL